MLPPTSTKEKTVKSNLRFGPNELNLIQNHRRLSCGVKCWLSSRSSSVWNLKSVTGMNGCHRFQIFFNVSNNHMLPVTYLQLSLISKSHFKRGLKEVKTYGFNVK